MQHILKKAYQTLTQELLEHRPRLGAAFEEARIEDCTVYLNRSQRIVVRRGYAPPFRHSETSLRIERGTVVRRLPNSHCRKHQTA